MKKQLVIIGVLALLISIGLRGCTSNPLKSEKDRFIGTWASSNWQPQQNNTSYMPQRHTYFSNGSCSVGDVFGIYEIEDGKLVEALANRQIIFTWDYSFSDNDTILTLPLVGEAYTLVLYKQ